MSLATVGSICLDSTSDFKSNILKAEALIREAQSKGCDWVVLPEVFPYIGPDNETFSIYEKIHGDVYQKMSDLAAELNIILFAGTIPRPLPTKNKLLNTLHVFDRHGKEIAQYDKTHLFELRDTKGSVKVSEKTIYEPGFNSRCIDIDGFHIALAICYDIRFLDFFQSQIVAKALDVVILPSAFTFETGKDHWELLLRARAIDLQCYVVGAAQTGCHFGTRKSYGHAMIVDPWSKVLSTTGESPGIAIAKLNSEEIAASRARLQQRLNRRTDLYK